MFYQEAKDPHKLLDEHQASLEELLLPRQIFQSFKSSLVASTDLLPPSARRFQEWTIGSLDRYERTESGRMNYFDGIMNKPEKGSKD